MANNLTLEDINNLYFWATKLEEEEINNISSENIESKEDILNLTCITARNSLPKEVFKLNRLKTLYIEVEDLTELPKEIGNLTNLKNLEIKCSNLKELPKEIGNLNNLERLIIEFPNLKELPKEIGNLNNLTTLEIECPNLNELPKEIWNLNNLTTLEIKCSNLKELPKEIWNLSRFEVEFDIKNNNNKELLKYIVDSPNNENKDVELKINIKKKED